MFAFFYINLNWFYIIALLIVAGGFGLRWLNKSENIDFLTAGAIGVAALVQIFMNITHIYSNSFLGFVLMIISSGFYFVMAMRALQINNTPYNKMIALLCVCAGIFSILGWRVFNIFTSLIDFQKWLYFIFMLGSVFCPAICMAECFTEAD